ncbi:MAG: amidohydrolase family protein [Pseudomonadales bacterium]|nr:amidohydrolase family protein [Pseudomonadales bacterium]
MPIPGDFHVIDPHIHQWDLLNTPRVLSLPKKLLGWNRKLYEGVVNLAAKQSDRNYVGKVDYVGHDYLPAHYAQDATELNLSHVVHVEAKWMAKTPLDVVDETRWVEQIFRSSQSKIDLGAIVGYVELRDPQAPQVIQAHRQASRRLVGLRQMLAWDDDKGIMRYCDKPRIFRDAVWRKHFELLEQNDLSFDAWFFHHQLDEMVELAQAFPNTRFMLCHMGTPIGIGGPYASYGHSHAKRQAIHSQWQMGMARVAECKNVSVKLSGFFMPVVGWGYHLRSESPQLSELVDSFKPLADYVIQQFGIERCMFASNFPMDKVSLGLKQLYDLYWEITCDLSAADKEKLFRQNAAAFYRIDL